MSHTKRISKRTRSVRMKRAETRPVAPSGSTPAAKPDDTKVRTDLVRNVRATLETRGFDLDSAFRAAIRKMIEVEIDS